MQELKQTRTARAMLVVKKREREKQRILKTSEPFFCAILVYSGFHIESWGPFKKSSPSQQCKQNKNFRTALWYYLRSQNLFCVFWSTCRYGRFLLILRRHTFKVIIASFNMFKLVLKNRRSKTGVGHPRFLKPSIFQHITFSATGNGKSRFFVPKYFLQTKETK
jgi:hypothetical protein